MDILVASTTASAVSLAVASSNVPVSAMLIPLRYSSSLFRLMVKLPIFSCINAAMKRTHTIKRSPSRMSLHLSIRSSAAPIRLLRLCGTYMLTIFSGSTSPPVWLMSSSSSLIRRICSLSAFFESRLSLRLMRGFFPSRVLMPSVPGRPPETSPESSAVKASLFTLSTSTGFGSCSSAAGIPAILSLSLSILSPVSHKPLQLVPFLHV